jgi:hypothetical protein
VITINLFNTSLFFDCALAQMTFGLSPMKNATDMFEDWLKGIERSVHSNSGGGMRYLLCNVKHSQLLTVY